MNEGHRIWEWNDEAAALVVLCVRAVQRQMVCAPFAFQLSAL